MKEEVVNLEVVVNNMEVLEYLKLNGCNVKVDIESIIETIKMSESIEVK